MTILEAAHDLLLEDIGVMPLWKKIPREKGHTYFEKRITVEDLEKKFKGAEQLGIPCGAVSCGIECMDFDDHNQHYDISAVFQDYCKDEYVKHLYDNGCIFIQKTPSGGYHIIYRYEAEHYQGNQRLAVWPKNKEGKYETKIETRGQCGYFVSWPSANYKKLTDKYINELQTITQDDRQYLIDRAKSFTEKVNEQGEIEEETGNYEFNDPVSFYNFKKKAHAKNILKDKGWRLLSTDKSGTEKWQRPGKDSGISATFGHKNNLFYVFSSSAYPFETNRYYTPFEILALLNFSKNWRSAANWISAKYMEEDVPYMRVGITFFKKIFKRDRYGVKRVELKKWSKDEIKDDHGKNFLYKVPHFDDFIIEPDNFNYHPVIGNCYNLYSAFAHTPKAGDITWSMRLIDHIFGDQKEIGLKYLKALYMHPKQMLPILVLVSEQRSTGKTTFLNWLNMIFGDNMTVIAPDELTNDFNFSYATMNIIGIEETIIEKQMTVEKLKKLATGKFISVNRKFIDSFKLPFFGKIVMTSNQPDKFIKVDEEEIRFFVRQIELPKFNNHKIEDDLLNEIPAFLHYLKNMPALDFTKSRALFTKEELENDTLKTVKEASKTGLYQDLYIIFEDYFDNHDVDSIEFTVGDIKKEYFERDNRINLKYIKNVLSKEFNLEVTRSWYTPLNSTLPDEKRVGRFYTLTRENFDKQEKIDDKSNEKDDIPF